MKREGESDKRLCWWLFDEAVNAKWLLNKNLKQKTNRQSYSMT